jgi:N-acetyl-gamma-glutamyl-phosphate reductase
VKWAERPVREVLPGVPSSWRFIPHADLLREAQSDDVALLATPAETSIQLAAPLIARGVSVVDLSGGFRLPADAYPDWYGFEHPYPKLLDRARYGMVDLLAWEPGEGPHLIANPGCYATAAILSLAPLVREGWIQGPVFADGKSGTTGAGRKAEERLSFSEVAENVAPYRVGHHQHTPEIERAIGLVGPSVTVHFVPHLIPMQRGLLVTSYAAAAKGGDPNQVLRSVYADRPTVEVLDSAPGTGSVRGTPFVRLHAHYDERSGSLTAFGALDNLVKGAASQALENLNRVLGLPQGTGLIRGTERAG